MRLLVPPIIIAWSEIEAIVESLVDLDLLSEYDRVSMLTSLPPIIDQMWNISFEETDR